ncbi:MAG: hypothetical protein Q9162_007933 [Coniocarpon cinnabarinum]
MALEVDSATWALLKLIASFDCALPWSLLDRATQTRYCWSPAGQLVQEDPQPNTVFNFALGKAFSTREYMQQCIGSLINAGYVDVSRDSQVIATDLAKRWDMQTPLSLDNLGMLCQAWPIPFHDLDFEQIVGGLSPLLVRFRSQFAALAKFEPQKRQLARVMIDWSRIVENDHYNTIFCETAMSLLGKPATEDCLAAEASLWRRWQAREFSCWLGGTYGPDSYAKAALNLAHVFEAQKTAIGKAKYESGPHALKRAMVALEDVRKDLEASPALSSTLLCRMRQHLLWKSIDFYLLIGHSEEANGCLQKAAAISMDWNPKLAGHVWHKEAQINSMRQ